MKKFRGKLYIGGILFISILLFLSACGTNQSSVRPSEPEDTHSETKPDPSTEKQEEPNQQVNESAEKNNEVAPIKDEPERKVEKVTKVTEKEAQRIVTDLMTGIVQVFREKGDQYGWYPGNPADFSVLRPDLLQFGTESFVDGFLRATAKEYYCDCDAQFFPDLNQLNIRFQLDENRGNQFTASNIEFLNELGNGGYTIRYTVVNENGKWLMDDLQFISYQERPLHVNGNEVKTYVEMGGSKAELLSETTYNGRKLFVIKNHDHNMIWGIYADTTESMYDIPDELLPPEYRSLTAEQAEQFVLERLVMRPIPK